MSSKLFIGGLPWSVSSERLQEAFSDFGEVVEAKVVMDRETGRSRGFGFVTFADGEAAERAMGMNGQDLDGRQVRVDFANDRRSDAPRRDDTAGYHNRGW